MGGGQVGGNACCRKQTALFQIIPQFADHHRGRGDAVVALAAADPGYIEDIAGRKQGLEKEIAVVMAAITVAQPWCIGHQIKGDRVLGAGKVLVVHPQQADDAERDGTHRHHIAEGDPAAEKGLAASGLGKGGVQVLRENDKRE